MVLTQDLVGHNTFALQAACLVNKRKGNFFVWTFFAILPDFYNTLRSGQKLALLVDIHEWCSLIWSDVEWYRHYPLTKMIHKVLSCTKATNIVLCTSNKTDMMQHNDRHWNGHGSVQWWIRDAFAFRERALTYDLLLALNVYHHSFQTIPYAKCYVNRRHNRMK